MKVSDIEEEIDWQTITKFRKNIEDIVETSSVLVVANSKFKNMLNIKFTQKYFPNNGIIYIIW